MVLEIILLAMLYLAVGFGFLIISEDELHHGNPLWKPVILLFWPICFAFMLLLYVPIIFFIDWVKEVIEYYRKKRDRR